MTTPANTHSKNNKFFHRESALPSDGSASNNAGIRRGGINTDKNTAKVSLLSGATQKFSQKSQS
jgi:hypothetical protein